MARFVFKRILILPPILLAVSIVVFLILRVGEGDPAMAYLRLSQIPPTDQALAEAREHLGLNLSLPVQYFNCRTLDLDRKFYVLLPRVLS